MKKKTIIQLKKTLRTITHKIIRLSSDRCYTCDKYLPDIKDRNAGHFWTQGGHGATRFDLRNMRVQCLSCNSFKSGNLAEYSTRLLNELGEEEFNQLSRLAHQSKKWTRDELENLIELHTSLLQTHETKN